MDGLEYVKLFETGLTYVESKPSDQEYDILGVVILLLYDFSDPSGLINDLCVFNGLANDEGV